MIYQKLKASALEAPADTLKMKDEEQYRWLPQNCPICEKPPSKFVGMRGGRAHRQHLGVECSISRCGSCGLLFPNPMPIPLNGPDQHYGVLPEDYFQHHDMNVKGGSALKLLHQAQELTGGKGRLLDIGTGRGELLRAAIQEGWTVKGIEPSNAFADFAVQYTGAEIKREPVERCGFDAESFDVVMLAAVLEHLYNPDETIREIARILRPGGALFVDVPNEKGLYFRVGNLYQKLRGRDWVVNLAPTFSPFHVFGFSPRSLRALLKKYKLKPEYWHVYAGKAMVPNRGGILGGLERFAANAITTLSNFGELGTYIETWAIKV